MTAILKTSSGQYELYIDSFSTTLKMGSQSSQLRESQSHYPIKPSQPNFTFVTTFTSQLNAKKFYSSIRAHHIDSLAKSPASSKVRFNWSEKDMSYEGYILSVQAGEKRFDIAPQVSVEMLLVKDLFSQTTTKMNDSSGITAILGEQYKWSNLGSWIGESAGDSLSDIFSDVDDAIDLGDAIRSVPSTPSVNNTKTRKAQRLME